MHPAKTAHLRALKWISMLLIAAMLSGLMSSALAAASAAATDAPSCHSMAGAGDEDDARRGNALDEFRCPYAHAVVGGAAPFPIDYRSPESPMLIAASGTSRSERPPLPPPRA
jgi:hypothetical protein